METEPKAAKETSFLGQILFGGLFFAGVVLLSYLLEGSRLSYILDHLLDNWLGVVVILALPFIIIELKNHRR